MSKRERGEKLKECAYWDDHTYHRNNFVTVFCCTVFSHTSEVVIALTFYVSVTKTVNLIGQVHLLVLTDTR